MAFFRRNPANDQQWLVVDLPEGVEVGGKVEVSKRDGSSTAVTIASILTLADGTPAATVARKVRGKGKPKPVTCPSCSHSFEA